MKRYGITIDLKGNVKNVRKYIEKKIKGSNVVAYFKIQLKKTKSPSGHD